MQNEGYQLLLDLINLIPFHNVARETERRHLTQVFVSSKLFLNDVIQHLNHQNEFQLIQLQICID